MADHLVELRHLLGLPLPKVKQILTLAFDPEYTCSLPRLLDDLQREDLNTAKARFLVGRITGDALSVGAVRLAREIEEPLSQATCERARSTLDATIAFLRDSLGVLLPSSSPSIQVHWHRSYRQLGYCHLGHSEMTAHTGRRAPLGWSAPASTVIRRPPASTSSRTYPRSARTIAATMSATRLSKAAHRLG